MFTSEPLTPENMQLNDVETPGFTQEPRILSHEVNKLSRQVEGLSTAMLQLIELQRDVHKKLDAALGGHLISNGEASAAQVV